MFTQILIWISKIYPISLWATVHSNIVMCCHADVITMVSNFNSFLKQNRKTKCTGRQRHCPVTSYVNLPTKKYMGLALALQQWCDHYSVKITVCVFFAIYFSLSKRKNQSMICYNTEFFLFFIFKWHMMQFMN